MEEEKLNKNAQNETPWEAEEEENEDTMNTIRSRIADACLAIAT